MTFDYYVLHIIIFDLSFYILHHIGAFFCHYELLTLLLNTFKRPNSNCSKQLTNNA